MVPPWRPTTLADIFRSFGLSVVKSLSEPRPGSRHFDGLLHHPGLRCADLLWWIGPSVLFRLYKHESARLWRNGAAIPYVPWYSYRIAVSTLVILPLRPLDFFCFFPHFRPPLNEGSLLPWVNKEEFFVIIWPAWSQKFSGNFSWNCQNMDTLDGFFQNSIFQLNQHRSQDHKHRKSKGAPPQHWGLFGACAFGMEASSSKLGRELQEKVPQQQ